jgi:hypothetical protein
VSPLKKGTAKTPRARRRREVQSKSLRPLRLCGENSPFFSKLNETTSPYPGYPGADGETIWIVRPLGQQCVDPTTYVYPDLATAAAALTSAGVTVLASEELALMVCEACDCPTSEHFRVLINTSDYGLAESLGWTPEN